MNEKRNTSQGSINEPEITQEDTDLEIEKLVMKAISGDVDAFGELYTSHVTKIYRYVYYRVYSRERAEDITQEVFLKAWKAIGSCKGKEKTFSSWLYRIARNHLINTLRSMKRFASIEKENFGDIVEPKMEVEAEIEEIPKIIAIKTELLSRLKKSNIEKTTTIENLKERVKELRNKTNTSRLKEINPLFLFTSSLCCYHLYLFFSHFLLLSFNSLFSF